MTNPFNFASVKKSSKVSSCRLTFFLCLIISMRSMMPSRTNYITIIFSSSDPACVTYK